MSAKPITVILVLGFCCLCVSLSQTLVIPLQPALPELLASTATNTSWVITATLLGGAVAMPTAGRLSDIRGRKPVLVTSGVLFLIGSVICALSSSLAPVLVGRALQGLAMGFIPVAISYVRETVPENLSNLAVSTISATLGVGGALGLPISALIAEAYGWNALFWFATGLGVAITASCWLILPDRPPLRRARLDLPGAMGLGTGVAGVLVGVTKGGDWGWTSPATLGAILGGLVLLVGWGFYETRHPDPLVNLRVAVRRPILLTNIAALLAGFGMMGQAIVIPQLLQMPVETGYGLGQTMLQAGLWMAPGGLMMLFFSPISARLLTVYGGRITLALGMAFMIAGYGAAMFLWGAPWTLMLASCIISAGIGISYAAMPTLIMENSPEEDSGAGVGVNALLRSMGTTSAGAVMAIILTTQSTATDRTLAPSEDAFRLCFLVGAVAAFIAMTVTLGISRKERTPAPVA